MQAIILAGGLGTRLKSVISDLPKPMAPINDKPFLAVLLDDLQQQGFTHVMLSVCHLKEKIIDYFGNEYRNITIHYAIESEPLGTGGAIQYALQSFDNTLPTFVINGDTFVEINYSAMLEQHTQTHADFTMAVYHQKDCSRYGEVVLNQQQRIIEFAHNKQPHAGWINAGIYLLNKNLLEQYELPPKFSFEQDFLKPKINQLAAYGYLAKDYFIDIGIPEDYKKMCHDFL